MRKDPKVEALLNRVLQGGCPNVWGSIPQRPLRIVEDQDWLDLDRVRR